jgi:hypothetical protein
LTTSSATVLYCPGKANECNRLKEEAMLPDNLTPQKLAFYEATVSNLGATKAPS